MNAARRAGKGRTMPDDKTKVKEDRRLIDFGDRDEVMRACKAMRCTELELLMASSMVGLIGNRFRAKIKDRLEGQRALLECYRDRWRDQERAERRQRAAKAKRRRK